MISAVCLEKRKMDFQYFYRKKAISILFLLAEIVVK